jgi:hypothetical protein
MRLFENSFLRRIFGPKMEEVAGSWRTLHNEEIRHLYPSPNIIRMIKIKDEMGGACSTHKGYDKCKQNPGPKT